METCQGVGFREQAFAAVPQGVCTSSDIVTLTFLEHAFTTSVPRDTAPSVVVGNANTIVFVIIFSGMNEKHTRALQGKAHRKHCPV